MKSRWVPRLRTGLDRFFRRPAVDMAVLVLVVASVVLLLVEFYGATTWARPATLAGDVITVAFIAELGLRWIAAPTTAAHWREFWLDWLAVVPFFRPMRALRILRFLRTARLLRLYRFGAILHRMAGTFEPRQYETALREATFHYAGPHEDAVRLAPELFHALCNLLDDGRIHREVRARVCQGLAYFITPFDVLPEEIHGAGGYLDQVYLCLRVLDGLRHELPEHVLEGAWEGEGGLLEVVDEMLPVTAAALGEHHPERILRYVGLPETEGVALGAGSAAV